MSRSFDGSGDRLVYTGVVVDTPPFTMATWFKRGAISSTQYLLNTCTQGSTNHSHRLAFSSANLFNASSTDTATSLSSGHTITDTASWHHAAGVWASATSRQCYLDGTADTVNTTSRTPSGIDRFKVGAGGSEGQVFNGLTAHSAVWGVALTADEIASLAAGLSPLLIRPASLVAYWPYLGRDSTEIDIIGRYDLAVTGAAASADEPRLRWPSRKRVIYVPAAGGQSASVGRSDETDTAIGLARSKSKAAQFAAETDIALALARQKAKAIDLASETETALELGRVKVKAVGLATETDGALAATAVKTRSTGRADETDTALAPGAPLGVGIASETDSAFALACLKSKVAQVATTTETALALTARKIRECGTATETDAALNLTPLKVGACGRADETDAAFACPPFGVIARPVGLAVEMDEALALAALVLSEAELPRGGDDVPDRGHRGWDRKRSRLKLRREREFTEQIRDLYRELTGDPRTAERAEAILAPVVAAIPAGGESEAAREAAIEARADALRARADAFEANALQAEIALRLLHRELRDWQEADDLQAIRPLLAQVL